MRLQTAFYRYAHRSMLVEILPSGVIEAPAFEHCSGWQPRTLSSAVSEFPFGQAVKQRLQLLSTSEHAALSNAKRARCR